MHHASEGWPFGVFLPIVLCWGILSVYATLLLTAVNPKFVSLTTACLLSPSVIFQCFLHISQTSVKMQKELNLFPLKFTCFTVSVMSSSSCPILIHGNFLPVSHDLSVSSPVRSTSCIHLKPLLCTSTAWAQSLICPSWVSLDSQL